MIAFTLIPKGDTVPVLISKTDYFNSIKNINLVDDEIIVRDKQYIYSSLEIKVSGGSVLIVGSLDASSNPNYPQATAGQAYRIASAGMIGGPTGRAVDVEDIIYALVDNIGGSQAVVGNSWTIWQGESLKMFERGTGVSSVKQVNTILPNTVYGNNSFGAGQGMAIYGDNNFATGSMSRLYGANNFGFLTNSSVYGTNHFAVGKQITFNSFSTKDSIFIANFTGTAINLGNTKNNHAQLRADSVTLSSPSSGGVFIGEDGDHEGTPQNITIKALGKLLLLNLPNASPGVPGAVWNNSGNLSIS
jgi:hypothetical protein